MLSKGFPYSSKLSFHTACVNALAFSKRNARFLASGGDDLRVSLWDFHQDNLTAPSVSLHGPRNNIFCLEFSSSNRYLYSGGTDEIILQFDIEHLNSNSNGVQSSPQATFREHQGAICGISCHNVRDEIFLSASQDGRILTHDTRSNIRSRKAQDTIQLSAEATDVKYHPRMEHLFLTSDSHGNVCLRDTRMAFGPLTSRTNEGIVQTYNTKLSKKAISYLGNPEVSSIAFDEEGTKFSATMLHYFPVIYKLSDPNPLAVCTSRYSPDGTLVPPTERSYRNSCTLKHGSFGSAGFETDGLYSAGSEDFRGYVWKIPGLEELAERRIEVDPDEWAACEWPDTVAFTSGFNELRSIPVELSTPLFRLTGHKSIVNSTLIHPHMPYIVTAGIENDIILHSPTPNSPCHSNMGQTPQNVRVLEDENATDREVYFWASVGLDTAMGSTEDSEITTIMMFDKILREEKDVDVFVLRRWSEGNDSSDEGGDEEEDEERDCDDLL